MAMKNTGAMQPVIDDLNRMTRQWKKRLDKAPLPLAADEPKAQKKAPPCREKITQRTIKNLASSEAENKLIWDSELKGFGVRRTPAGAVSFFLNYRTTHGQQRRYKIGRAPEWTAEASRAEAAELKPKIDKGFDPLEAKQKLREEPTLAYLGEEYLKYRGDKSESTKRNDKAAINTIINPSLGKLRLAAVNTHHIEKLKKMLEATPYRANRVLALLSNMFNKAIAWKWTTENPAGKKAGVQRYDEEKRERWLNDDELKRLHEALDKYTDQKAANALRLIALTGSRKGEVLKATWEEFDLDRGVWTKPSHHTKQKKRNISR